MRNHNLQAKIFRIILILLLPVSFSVFIQCGVRAGRQPDILVIDDAHISIKINEYLNIYADESAKLTLNDILKPELQSQFKSNNDAKTGWGYTDVAVWFRLKYRISENSEITGNQLLLEIGYPLLDSVDFFIQKNGRWKKIESGERLNLSSRPYIHENFILPLDAEPGSSGTVIIRIQSESSLYAPAFIHDERSFHEIEVNQKIFHGMYYGIAGALLIYNIFIFLIIRNKSYLFYIFWIGSFTVLQSIWNGHAFRYFWPESPLWANYSGILFIYLSIIFAVLFTIHFLDMKNNFPRLIRYFYGGLFLLILLTAFSYFLTYSAAVQLGNFLSFTFIIIAMTSAVYLYRKGYKPARYYIMAWAAMFAGVLLINFQSGVTVFSNSIFLYGFQAASVFEMLFLSFALTDNIKLLQGKVEDAQDDLIENEKLTREIIEASKERLEKQIDLRTRDLEEAKEQAEKAIELKDKFISLVSHDLKSPLLGLLSLMDIFDEDPGQKSVDETTRIRLIDQLRNSTRGLLDMIDQLLNIGRLKTGKIRISPEYFEVQDAVEEAILLFSGLAADKNITLENNINKKLNLYGDRMLIKEVIQNLISNALKFTNPEGSIEIFLPRNKKGCIAVRDNGVGMDERLIENIFKQRSITSLGTASERGSGLGLMFCLDIMEDHGGALEVKSTKKKGTTFYICLPDPHDAVMIVDDNESVRKSVRDFLRGRNFYVIEAHDGLHALEILEGIKPLLVITDIHMPEMGGFDLLKKIRNTDDIKDIPVIVISSGPSLGDYNQSGLDEVVLEMGANGFLSKPINFEKFTVMVDAAIQHTG